MVFPRSQAWEFMHFSVERDSEKPVGRNRAALRPTKLDTFGLKKIPIERNY